MKKEPRFPLLSARGNWIFVEIVTIFVIILGCTVYVWWRESGTVGQTGYETFKNVVNIVASFSHLVIIFVVCIFEIGGEIMIRFTYLLQKATEQGIEQGIEQGKSEIYRAWYADWEKRRQAAAEKGIPFDDPPPPNPDNHINQG